MLKEYAGIGSKIELEAVGSRTEGNSSPVKYRSQLLDEIDDKKAVIAMPLVNGRLIPLEIGDRYLLYLYGKSNLYECTVVITNRYRQKNIFMLEVEALSAVVKKQRREYFRLPVVVDLEYEIMADASTPMETGQIDQTASLKPQTGIMIDISGGGCKFNTKEMIKPETSVKIKFALTGKRGTSEFELLGTIISCSELMTIPTRYEHRVKFDIISKDAREEIVRYIFDQERELRRKEKGLS